MTAPKRAMVLAAGLGTRMRPLQRPHAQAAGAVGGKALIDYVLDRLADAGVERAVVNVHHLADQIERHLAQRAAPEIVISDERDELLGTGGGVVKALPQLGEAPFFHVNSDTIWIDGVKPNLGRLAAAFDPARMDALLLLAPAATSIGYTGRGDFAMAPDGRLTRRGEREVVPFVYAGAAILHARLVRRTRRPAPSRCRRCSTAPPTPGGCAACGSKACGCMSARPRRSGRRGGDPRQRGLIRRQAGPDQQQRVSERPAKGRIARIASCNDTVHHSAWRLPASSPFRRRRRSCRR